MLRLREAPPAGEVAGLALALGLPRAVAAIGWQRGLRDAAAWQLWRESDPAFKPMLDSARAERTALPSSS
jgi:hypothetical protein